MLELGNKRNQQFANAGKSPYSYKHYFESLGMDHTSIDWNGLDGALKLDLREPLSLPPFDMITNIGTTEHVDNQEGVWRNIHNLCKVGGVIASWTPLEGDWWWHGVYYPRPEFFEQFKENGYEIEMLDVACEYPNRVIRARLKKIAHNDFWMPADMTIFHNKMRAR
jgi:SAM-dependent methyltransferase